MGEVLVGRHNSGEGYTTGTGQLLVDVHKKDDDCAEGCVIHNPSDHPMRDFPTHYRQAGLFDIKPSHMERLCPHGVGHPDPDAMAFVAKRFGVEEAQTLGVHGCDGCCAGSYGRLEAIIEAAS